MFTKIKQKKITVIAFCLSFLLVCFVVVMGVQGFFNAKLWSQYPLNNNDQTHFVVQLNKGQHYKAIQLASQPGAPDFAESLQNVVTQETGGETPAFSLEKSFYSFVPDRNALPSGFALDNKKQQVIGYFHSSKERYWLVKTRQEVAAEEKQLPANTVRARQFDPQQRWFFQSYPFSENTKVTYTFRALFKKYWLAADEEADSPSAIVYNNKGKKVGAIAMRPAMDEEARLRVYEGEFKAGLSRYHVVVPTSFFAQRFNAFGESFTIHNERGEVVGDITTLLHAGDSYDTDTNTVSGTQHTYPNKIAGLQFLFGKPAVYFLENFHYVRGDDDLQGRDVLNVFFNNTTLLQEVYPYQMPLYLFPYKEEVGIVYADTILFDERIIANAEHSFPPSLFMSTKLCVKPYAVSEAKQLCGTIPMLHVYNDGTLFILQKQKSNDYTADESGYTLLKINLNDYR